MGTHFLSGRLVWLYSKSWFLCDLFTLITLGCFSGTGTMVWTVSVSDVNLKYMGKHHDDVIKWKHFPRNWPFVRGIHWSPVNSPHKGQWRGTLMFSLICAGINDWVNNREAGDLRRNRAHYDVIVMIQIGSGDNLAPIRCQAITWAKDDPVHWRTYISTGVGGLVGGGGGGGGGGRGVKMLMSS